MQSVAWLHRLKSKIDHVDKDVDSKGSYVREEENGWELENLDLEEFGGIGAQLERNDPLGPRGKCPFLDIKNVYKWILIDKSIGNCFPTFIGFSKIVITFKFVAHWVTIL